MISEHPLRRPPTDELRILLPRGTVSRRSEQQSGAGRGVQAAHPRSREPAECFSQVRTGTLRSAGVGVFTPRKVASTTYTSGPFPPPPAHHWVRVLNKLFKTDDGHFKSC